MCGRARMGFGKGRSRCRLTAIRHPAECADAAISEGALFSRAGSFTDPGADTWAATVNYGDGI